MAKINLRKQKQSDMKDNHIVCDKCKGIGLEEIAKYTYDYCRKCDGSGYIKKESNINFNN